MNIRQLRIFKVVCEEENITRAADKLFMTQPAVSHVIHDLEKELGTKLFDRISKKIGLNGTGRLFLDKVNQVLVPYDELENSVHTLEKEAAIRIGSSITIANYWLPQVMQIFHATYDKTPVTVNVNSAKEVMRQLNEHEIDLALVEGAILNENCVKIPFASYHLSVVCSAQSELAQKREITIQELREEKLLLREKGSAIRDILDSVLYLHDIAIEPIWTSVNSQALINAVKHNLGITILPDMLVEKEVENGELCLLKIRGIELYNDNHIVYLKDKYLTHPITQLMDMIKQ